MVLGGSSVQQVTVTDVEKRRLPSKHYVYIIEVIWSNGTKNVIFRRYSKFFTLQTKLIERFPVEGGVKDPSCRVLPFLPGKIIFGRSHVREVALKRKDPINEYCQALINLPNHISMCDEVIHFFETSTDDVEALTNISERKRGSIKTADSISEPVLLEQYIVLADYKKTSKNQVSLVEGDVVEVIEKHENGWWLVSVEDEQGWAPSSYLEAINSASNEPPVRDCGKDEEIEYICVRKFDATQDDELSLDLGTVVQVCQKHMDGWWLLSVKDSKGWAPRAHLKRVPKTAQQCGHKQIAGGRINEAVKSPAVKGKRVEPPPRRKTVKSKIKERQSPPNDNREQQGQREVEYVTSAEIRAQLGTNTVMVQEGTSIEVVEKAPNGWWYVRIGKDEGWIPASEIQRKRKGQPLEYDDIYENVANLKFEASDPEDHEYAYIDSDRAIGHHEDPVIAKCVTLGAYVAVDDNGITFQEGEFADILDKDSSGWWFVRIDDREGWAPSTYLKNVNSPLKIKSGPLDKRLPSKILIGVPPTKPKRGVDPFKYENVDIESKSEEPKTNEVKKAPGRPAAPAKISTDQSGHVDKVQGVAGTSSAKKVPVIPRKISNPTQPEEAGVQRKKVVSKVGSPEVVSELDLLMKARREALEHGTALDTKSESEQQQSRSSGADKGIAAKSEGRPIPQPRPRPLSHHPPDVAKDKLDAGPVPNVSATGHLRSPRLREKREKLEKVANSKGNVGIVPKKKIPPPRPSPPSLKKAAPNRPPPPHGVGGSASKLKDENSFVALCDYDDSDEGVLSFKQGELIHIIETDEGGWWLARVGDREGWVPSNFLGKR